MVNTVEISTVTNAPFVINSFCILTDQKRAKPTSEIANYFKKRLESTVGRLSVEYALKKFFRKRMEDSDF